MTNYWSTNPYLRMVLNDAMFANVDPVFETKLICHFTLWAFTKTHPEEVILSLFS